MAQMSAILSMVRLAKLHDSYQRLCNLATIKCNGDIRVYIERNDTSPGGSIVISRGSNQYTLQLVPIGKDWLLSALRDHQIDWRQHLSGREDDIFAAIDQHIRTYLLDSRPVQAAQAMPLAPRYRQRNRRSDPERWSAL